METRIQVVAILASLALFLIVFELVRRRRLMERYALLWMFSMLVLLGLSVWKHLLEELAEGVGIYYAPSALFAVAFAFVLIMLLHFSLVISRLAEQSKVLAQRVSIMQQRIDDLEAAERSRAEQRRDEYVSG